MKRKIRITWLDQHGKEHTDTVDVTDPRNWCRRQDWRDDGYYAECTRPKGHIGPCAFGMYCKANQYVPLTITKAKP